MHSEEIAEPIKIRFFTPGVFVLIALMAIAAIFGLFRFLFGLGLVTNLDNQFPWGLWIGIDVVTGVALAAGGFTSSALAYVFNREQFHSVIRPALLTAMLGYTFVALGLTVDIGRYWNIWRPVISWNPTSVLFEVAMCVIIYLTVLYIEFIPIFIERFSGRVSLPGRLGKLNLFVEAILDIAGAILGKIMFLFIIAGIVLSCLHQSGLGSLMLIAGYKVHPLWYTPILPLLFLLSAIAVGYPMIVFESMIASKTFKREPEMEVLAPLAKFIPILIGSYLVVKIGDMIVRGTYIYLLDGTLQSNSYIIEIVFGVILPFVMLLFKRIRESAGLLFFTSTLYVLGVVLNRVNVFIISYTPPYMAERYFPAIGEIAITIGFIAALIFLYRLFVTIFPVISGHAKSIKTVCLITLASFIILGNSSISKADEQNRFQDKRLISSPVKTIPSIDDSPKIRILNSETINMATDLYDPVRFMHNKHANVIKDCSVCHHRIPREEDDTYGEPMSMDRLIRLKIIPKSCANCHNQPWNPEKINVPGLRGAYHQKCLGCHREATQISEADTIQYERIARGLKGIKSPAGKAPIDCLSCHARRVPDHKDSIKLAGTPDARSVTKECLTCHEDQAEDIMSSSHWRWEGPSPFTIGYENRIDLGKKSHMINNTTMSLKGNWSECTKCHIGYGWDEEKFDFSDKTNIDCLVCHDATGAYIKAISGAGMPDKSVDLLKVAQNVGQATRKTCGTNCHFSGAEDDPMSHGTMNPKLLEATRKFDVHMALDGVDMACQDCHRTRYHKISGRSISTPVVEGTFSCETCHTDKPHIETSLLSAHLNIHSDHVACQTCHIPLYSKEVKTVTRWDWSGTTDTGVEEEELGPDHRRTFDRSLGNLTWKSNIRPDYRWYNKTVKRHLIGDPVENKVTELNRPVGNIKDHSSKIYPFKIVTGKQLYDRLYKILIPARLKEGYWEHRDWNKAAEQGMELAGMPYSGEYDFTETIFFHGLNHEVLPKEQALSCANCHSTLNTQDSCLKCHKAPGDMDLNNLALHGMDLTKLGKADSITDYLNFKKLGYDGDPIETGGRFKRLHLSNSVDKETKESFLRTEEPDQEEGQ